MSGKIKLDWFKLNELHIELGKLYLELSNKEKKELLPTIDCETDYADYFFNIGGLLDFYNGD